MALSIVTLPAVEPVDLATAKAWLRVDGAAEDSLITALLGAARQRYDGRDGILGRALITQTWDLWLDRFPGSVCGDEHSGHGFFAPLREMGGILLPLAPVQSVTWVKYTDAAGAVQTLAAGTDYQLDLTSVPSRILPSYTAITWPWPRQIPNAVTVRFVAGYGNNGAAVPSGITQAILANVALWYEDRTAAGNKFPGDALALKYRPSWFG